MSGQPLHRAEVEEAFGTPGFARLLSRTSNNAFAAATEASEVLGLRNVPFRPGLLLLFLLHSTEIPIQDCHLHTYPPLDLWLPSLALLNGVHDYILYVVEEKLSGGLGIITNCGIIMLSFCTCIYQSRP